MGHSEHYLAKSDRRAEYPSELTEEDSKFLEETLREIKYLYMRLNRFEGDDD